MLPINLCKQCGKPIPENDYICFKCAKKVAPPFYKCKYFNNFICERTGDDCITKCAMGEEESE